MNDEEERGLKALYDMLVQGAEFPGTNECSPKSLNMWLGHMETLNSVMLQFYNADMVRKYQEVRGKMESLPGEMDEREMLQGYDHGFQLLGIISMSFANEKLLVGNPMGMRIIYDLFVKILNFPRANALSPSAILQLFNRIRGLHSLMVSYMGEQHLREYRIIVRQLMDISRLFPSEEYVLKSRDWLLNWIGLIARLLQEKNMLIPEELSFSDRIGGGRK